MGRPGGDGSPRVPPPIAYLCVADVLGVAERRRATRSAVGASLPTLRPVPHQIEGAGARVPGGLIGRNALFDDLLPNLRIRQFGAGATGHKNERDDPEKHCHHYSMPLLRWLAVHFLEAGYPIAKKNRLTFREGHFVGGADSTANEGF